VSLRRDIHSALESVEPSTAGMPDRVLHAVQADVPARMRRNRYMSRVVAPLPLVAIFVVIALIVAIFVGGRLVHDWQLSQHGTPAGNSQPTQFQREVAALEQRALVLPTVKAGADCPDTGNTNSAGYTYGSGPVYADGSSAVPSAWGNFFDIPWFTDPNLTGPVLVRGTDLQGHSVVFTGAGAYGPVIANDPAQKSPALHSEFVFDAGHPHLRENGYGYFLVRQGLPKDAGVCAGFQIDGPSFTEIVTTAG
jgi:hypothetical protein